MIATSTPSGFIERAAKKWGAEVIENRERIGIAADWNFALRCAGAQYVTLAHQDDIYAPEFLTRTLELLGKHRGALCFTSYQEIDDLGRPRASKTSRVKHLVEWLTIGRQELPNPSQLRAFMLFGNPLPCSSVTFDTRQLTDFEFSAEYESNLDWDAWCRLLNRGEAFLHVPDRLVGRRHNSETTTYRLIADGRRQKEDLMMFRRLWPRPFSDMIAYIYRAGY